MKTVLVSLCLLGEKCRFDGGESRSDRLTGLASEKQFIGICPELESGLLVPRKRCEIIGGDGSDVLDTKARVVSEDGSDLSLYFINGAAITLEKAAKSKIEMAILKENSPSCGSTHIYDGTFTGQRRTGHGVTAALLKRHGIKVVSDEHLKDICI